MDKAKKFATARPVLTTALFIGLAIYGSLYSAANVSLRHTTAVSFASVTTVHH